MLLRLSASANTSLTRSCSSTSMCFGNIAGHSSGREGPFFQKLLVRGTDRDGLGMAVLENFSPEVSLEETEDDAADAPAEKASHQCRGGHAPARTQSGEAVQER